MALLKNIKAISLLFYHYLFLFLVSSIVLSDLEFQFEEATIEDIQNAFEQRWLTSGDLVQFYMDKIKELNPKLRCVLEVNPEATHEAD